MRTILAVLTAAGLAACAAPASPLPATDAVALSGGACFRSADIRAHRYADGKTMYLSVRGEGVYRIGMRNNCLTGATSSDPIVTRQPPGAGDALDPALAESTGEAAEALRTAGRQGRQSVVTPGGNRGHEHPGHQEQSQDRRHGYRPP